MGIKEQRQTEGIQPTILSF